MKKIINGEELEIPTHVAIIMDGNGRWAKKRGQARSFGHQAGAETPNARYPRLTTETVQNNTQSSSVWLVDGSFLKLRNCEVYYKLPHSVVNKWHLNSAKLYVRGVDLFCWDHIKEIDPESIGNGIPTTRSINIGLSVGF